MFETLRTIVGRGQRAEVLRECRNCGTSVDSADRCPDCDSGDIVRYEID